MKKSRSPKKVKSNQESSGQHGSILAMFKKQRAKADEQKQSELNWIESKMQGNPSVNEDAARTHLAEHTCLSNEDTPSTSGYFPLSTDPNSDGKTKLKSKLSLDKLKVGKSSANLKRKSSDNGPNTQHPSKKTVTKSDNGIPGSVKTSELDTCMNKENSTDCESETEYKCISICDMKESDSFNVKIQESQTISKNENASSSNSCISAEESQNDPGPSISYSDVKDLNSQMSSDTISCVQDSQINHAESESADGQSQEIESQKEEGAEEYKVPYYLENFVLILNTVTNDEFYAYLFDDEDRKVIETFNNLSDNGQKLYVRLFGRMLRWLRKSKIVYPKIAEDLTETLGELCGSQLVMSEQEMTDLEDVLKSLPAPDIKTVAKSLKLSLSLGREDGIAAILKHTSQVNIGSFFKKPSSGRGGKASATPKGSRGGGLTALQRSVLQRSKKLLGSCYRLRREPRVVFMRVLMLFSLHNTRLEDADRDTGQQQIFQMLMSNIGRVKYPEYKIHRETKIFKDRECLIRFTHALQMETDIHEALEKKEFDEANLIYTDAVRISGELSEDVDVQKHDTNLPHFLRCYTAGAVHTRVLSYGVELLQFTKKYACATEQLRALIEQEMYHLDYRGRWCERLALNLDFHLKQPEKALDVIKQSLADGQIRKGHRLALFQRAQKICQTASSKHKARWADFAEDAMNAVQQAPEVFIQARKQDVPGGFPLFISEDSYTGAENDHVTFMKRVEDVALQHYAKNGYPNGIHAEGSSLTFFFGIFMWDAIFAPGVPDVFYNLYQTHPLDLYSLHFYEARKDIIDEQLDWVRTASRDDLEARLRSQWETHENTLCVGVNWEVYADVDEAVGFLRCVGGVHLAAIFERFARDMRFTRSGLPDLTVWNTETGKFKLVEVKGPGDRLSTKQILWLDYFLAVGIDAEVCYVKAIGAKKLR